MWPQIRGLLKALEEEERPVRRFLWTLQNGVFAISEELVKQRGRNGILL
jgi:hypothetical protein